MKFFTSLIIFFCFVFYVSGQVRDVRSKVAQDRNDAGSALKSESRSYSGGGGFDKPDWDGGCGAFIAEALFYYTFQGIYMGLNAGQQAMRYRQSDYPETFSFEGALNAGFDFNTRTTALVPSLRLNHGLFASEVRYASTRDVTGVLDVFDWQVLVLRVPVKNLKFEYGIGFSHVFSPSKSYLDQNVGFDWCLLKRRLTLKAHYRWSQNTNLGNRYRQESDFSSDYEILHSGKFRLAPMVGFSYFNYFDSTKFNMVKAGLIFRFF
ncbi:hypothetical protein ACT3CD_07415 [Geofilum sp. OHC36d9]|uniref:hypothetical protein n=1 Tax=Geofilum sp. OHC36d9 TaxID=3458413 RepID=UPI004034170B